MPTTSHDVLLPGIELDYSPNCYVESVAAILNYYGFDGSGLVDHHLNFVLHAGSQYTFQFRVGAYLDEDINRSVFSQAGITIRQRNLESWEEFHKFIKRTLLAGFPILLSCDSFFLPFIAKSRDHTPTNIIVYGMSTEGAQFYIKSVVFGNRPWQSERRCEYILSRDELRLACNSKSPTNTIKNEWFEFDMTSARKVPVNLDSVWRQNIAAMTRSGPLASTYSGLVGLGRFRGWFATSLETSERPKITAFLEDLFVQLQTIVSQRKRYRRFLEAYAPVTSRPVVTYKNLASRWDVFRNMCLKYAKRIDEPLKKHLVNKLDELFYLENQGISDLKQFQAEGHHSTVTLNQESHTSKGVDTMPTKSGLERRRLL